MRDGIVYTFTLTVFLAGIVLFNQPLYASSNDPYESGYDHGCDDARISNPLDRYINQPEKGPADHSDEFMEGYHDGFASCSVSDERVTESLSNSNNDPIIELQGENSTNNSSLYLLISYGIVFIADLILIGLRWKKRSTKTRAKISLLLLFTSLGTTLFGLTSEVYNDNERMIFLIFSLLILLVILIILVAKRNKTREDFSSETKKEALSDQDYKCAICGKFMDHWDRDFDHKNGNRSDNKLSNCRALHPKCHRRMHALGER